MREIKIFCHATELMKLFVDGFNASSGSRRPSSNKDSLKNEKGFDRTRGTYKAATSTSNRMSAPLRKSKDGE